MYSQVPLAEAGKKKDDYGNDVCKENFPKSLIRIRIFS